jgi:hypothetical protein
MTVLAMVACLAAASRPLAAQQEPPALAAWTVSGGIGAWTIFRFEVAHETGGRFSPAGALGAHPMGVPALEFLVRTRPGARGGSPYGYLFEAGVLGFLPNTQFGDDTHPGVGLHLTAGHDWGWGARRFVRFKAGGGVYQEFPSDEDEGEEEGETIVVPVLSLEVGWRLGSAGVP